MAEEAILRSQGVTREDQHEQGAGVDVADDLALPVVAAGELLAVEPAVDVLSVQRLLEALDDRAVLAGVAEE